MATMTAAGPATTMKAARRDRYCSADALELVEVPVPELSDDGVLVRVRAASVNRGDWYVMSGRPWAGRASIGLTKPKVQALGNDFAGIVEAVGRDVTGLEPGDEVFGGRTGAFGEYVNARSVVKKPANVSFEEAAAVPVAGLTALQGLRDHAGLEPGQTVLVNGASGGVGTFAVQIAKALGASHVTAVCSTRNVEQARELGADRVIDYTREDFTRIGERFDILFDNAGNRSWRECCRILKPNGMFLLVGGKKSNPLLGPLAHVAAVKLSSLVSRRRAAFYIAKFNKPDLTTLAEWLESGRVTPVVERTYALDEIGEAMRYMGEGHARGKIVVTI